MRKTVALIALLLAATTCLASTKDAEIARFTHELDGLHADIVAGRRFSHVDEETERELLRLNERMLELVRPIDRFADLPQPEREELLAAQASLREMLDEVDLDRPRCRVERRTGSNMRESVCSTKREEQMLRDESQRFLTHPRACVGQQCGRGE